MNCRYCAPGDVYKVVPCVVVVVAVVNAAAAVVIQAVFETSLQIIVTCRWIG
jgi:hypothetical protein